MSPARSEPAFPLRTESTRRESLTSFRRAGHQKSTAAALRCHSLICGETEIRTRDTLLEYTRFPGVPLKPLEHLSNVTPVKIGTTKVSIFFGILAKNPKNKIFKFFQKCCKFQIVSSLWVWAYSLLCRVVYKSANFNKKPINKPSGGHLYII